LASDILPREAEITCSKLKILGVSQILLALAQTHDNLTPKDDISKIDIPESV
jgi:hypothetical protein